MLEGLKHLLAGKRPREEEEAREREITHLRHDVKNSIQAVQSGRRIIQTMSGMIELNKRSPSR